MADVSDTDIPDPEAASHALASLAARAEVLGERIAAATGRIAALEGGKPWGTAQEYGGRFEKVYSAGEGGAEFVRTNARILAQETSQGATVAHQALQGSVQVDQDGANLFRVAGSDAVTAQVNRIKEAGVAEQNRQAHE